MSLIVVSLSFLPIYLSMIFIFLRMKKEAEKSINLASQRYFIVIGRFRVSPIIRCSVLTIKKYECFQLSIAKTLHTAFFHSHRTNIGTKKKLCLFYELLKFSIWEKWITFLKIALWGSTRFVCNTSLHNPFHF